MKNILYLLMIAVMAITVSACEPENEEVEPAETDMIDTISQAEPEDLENVVEDKSQRPSPPDSASATVGNLMVKVNYGSPAVKGRTIWGELVPYGQVWRTGANEASTIEFSQDVMINGKPLPAGKYGLFTVPSQGNWTVIFNKVWDQWGAFEYEESEDALRIQVNPKNSRDHAERLNFKVNQVDENTAEVVFNWGNMSWSFNVKPQQNKA